MTRERAIPICDLNDVMSALHADIAECDWNVRCVPKADIGLKTHLSEKGLGRAARSPLLDMSQGCP